MLFTVADPDLQIREGGGGGGGSGRPNPEMMGGRAKKHFFSAVRASVWSKTKGDSLDPPLIYTFF